MREIRELNARLREEARGHLPTAGLMLGRNDVPAELGKIPVRLKEEIDALRSALNCVIPDDFSYTLWLGDREPDLMLEYENGPMTAGFHGHAWKDELSIYDQLRALDWNEERTWAIKGTEGFDRIVEVARTLPVMIPATKQLQRRFAEEVRAYIKEKRGDGSTVHALIWDGEESLFDADFDGMDHFRRELSDIMTHMAQVVTVVAGGKPLPVGKIDALKKAALSNLDDMPISHAKASGKFAFIMNQAQTQQQEPEKGGT